MFPFTLIALDGAIDVTHEQQTCLVTNRTEQQEPTVANNAHIAEKVGCLHEAIHVTSQVKVVERVAKYSYCGASTAQHRSPPPLVVFRGELEVRQAHRHECRDEDENDEYDEQHAVNCIHLVSPHRGEDVEELDVNCTQWGGKLKNCTQKA